MKKSIFLIMLLLILTACNSSADKTQEISTSNQYEETNPSHEDNDFKSLKQNGDYSELFSRDEKNCEVLTSTEMASVLMLNTTNIDLNQEVPGYCRYELKLNDGTKTILSIHPIAWKRKSIQSEIASYEKTVNDMDDKDTFGDYLVLSDFKDTYFGIRERRGELFMFNPNYDTVISIKFGSAVEAMQNKMTFTEAQKNERRDNAVAVANFLLDKFRS